MVFKTLCAIPYNAQRCFFKKLDKIRTMETEEKRLDLNIELAVTPEKGVYIHKCVTNDWPAKLLLEVMGMVDEKIRAYYCAKG